MAQLDSNLNDDRFSHTIYSLIAKWAEKRPNSIAIKGLNRFPLTYSRLYQHIKKTVESLNEMDITREDRVAIVLPNGPDTATAFLSLTAATTCAPLNPNYKIKEFDFYFSNLKAKALIIPTDMESPAIKIAERQEMGIIYLSPLSEAGLFTLESKIVNPNVHKQFTQSDDIALILHTSGTTSRPKLVPLTHYNLCTSAKSIQKTLQLQEEDCCLNIMPLFHVHGLIGALLSTIIAGASIACTPGFYAPHFFEWVKLFKPTWYTAVPTMHQAILERLKKCKKPLNYNKLRLIRSSSSALSPKVMNELEEMFNVPVIESYGMTEASHQIASNPLPPYKRKAGSVGLPTGPEIAIIDDNGNFLKKGDIGEIVVRGSNLFRGYENNPKANVSSFINGWFRTGDQGYFDEDDYLIIRGRIKEIINRGGEKISPKEIDEVLLNHPDILQAMTFAVPSSKLGEEIGAAIVLRDNVNITEWDVQMYVANQLADFKVPNHILFLEEIPKGPTGKLQRVNLAKNLGLLSISITEKNRALYKAPETPIEEKLVKIWSEVLRLDQIGINDNYFQLGGDSIQGAIILSIICDSFHLKRIPLSIFLHAPTIKKMAQILNQKDFAIPSASLVAIRKTGIKPPIYCVHACEGEIMFFNTLTKYLPPEFPYYALRAQGLEGLQEPYTRVEDMASHYVKEIRAIQPIGPYILGGAGVGGIIALEMAHQLASKDDNVELLILIDTILPHSLQLEQTSIKPICQLKSVIQVLFNLVSQIRLRGLANYFQEIIFPKTTRKNYILKFGLYRYNVIEKTQNATEKYKPKKYGGPVVLFMSSKRTRFPRDPRFRINPWKQIAIGKFNAYIIPGQHLDILKEPNVKLLAQILKYFLNRIKT